MFNEVTFLPIDGRRISWNKASLSRYTCEWRDKLIVLWTLNRQAKIFSCIQCFYYHENASKINTSKCKNQNICNEYLPVQSEQSKLKTCVNCPKLTKKDTRVTSYRDIKEHWHHSSVKIPHLFLVFHCCIWGELLTGFTS